MKFGHHGANHPVKDLDTGRVAITSQNHGFAVDAINPMGAIYLTVKVDYIGKTTPEGEVLKNSADVNFYLIKEAKMGIVPFSAFGTDNSVNWFRASVGGCSLEDIQKMIPRMRLALSKLN